MRRRELGQYDPRDAISRGRNGTADRVAADRLSDEDVGEAYESTPKSRVAAYPRTKREVCYGVLLPRAAAATTTSIATTTNALLLPPPPPPPPSPSPPPSSSSPPRHCLVVHSALPLLSVECPSAGKRATEKANRRSNREKEGYAPPRGTRLGIGAPTTQWTMGRPTIERIGVIAHAGAARPSPILAD
ncbi:hypothetical protein HN011_012228, partial [Eciton burchellii]